MKRWIILLLTCSLTTIYAQKINLKKEKLLVDGKELLSYKKVPNYSEYYFYTLNTNNELFYIKYDRNGTFEYDGDNFVKIFFTKKGIKVESKSLPFGKSGEKLIERLFFDGILTNDGNLNEEKITDFKTKYDDFITK